MERRIKYSPPSIDYKKRLKRITIPRQSMSINEIVERFVRNQPITGVTQRDPVYLDQSEHDFEKLNRMSFDDKFQMAQDLKEEAESIQDAMREERARKASDEHERKEKRKASTQRPDQSGMDNLDNTMPDDTDLKNSDLHGSRDKHGRSKQ